MSESPSWLYYTAVPWLSLTLIPGSTLHFTENPYPIQDFIFLQLQTIFSSTTRCSNITRGCESQRGIKLHLDLIPL